MSKKPSTNPKLRVLEEQERLVVPVETEEPAVTEGDSVVVLQPDKDARHDAKTFKPDVADILDSNEEEIDTEAEWGMSQRKAPPLGWFVLAGIVVVGLALWAVLSVFKAQPELEVVDREKENLEVRRAKEALEVKKTLEAMEEAAEGYLGATTVDEMLPYVRHPARVEPLMRQYYQTHSIQPSGFERFERTRSLGLESYSFVRGEVVLADGGSKQLLFQQLGDQRFAVDWEADVCYQPIPWKKYISDRSVEPVEMRVLLKQDHFYAYEFRNEQEFDCYRLTAKGHDDHLFGYTRKGSKEAMALGTYVEKNGLHVNGAKPQPLILKIRFPKSKISKKCVWIDQLVEPRWVYIKDPNEEEK